jgi:hypothetical protein
MTKETLATAMALILVEIDGSGIEQGRTYTDKTTGTTKPLRGRQNGFVWQGARYPLQVSIDIPEGKSPYRPGTYLMSGALFESGKFGRIEFRGTRDMQLIPLSEAVPALAAALQEETGEVIDLDAAKRTGTK